MIKGVKVYFDGSHYIGILPNYYKAKKKGKNKDYTAEIDGKTVDLKQMYNEARENNRDKSRKERNKVIEKQFTELFKDSEIAVEFVKSQNERVRKNRNSKLFTLHKKLNILFPNYFCTFTYDDKKMTEKEFKKKLKYKLNNLSCRNGWKYIGVWERTPENNRLHFHAIIRVPEGQMIGELVEKRDFDTRHKKMQTTIQNTYFNERFGRSDFKEINEHALDEAINYMIKYIEKSGERLVYARGIKPYFKADILEEDIACLLDEDNPGKILLFDNFLCIKDGEVIGTVSPEVIDKMDKCD